MSKLFLFVKHIRAKHYWYLFVFLVICITSVSIVLVDNTPTHIVSIEVTAQGFLPSDIFIQQGDVVTFSNTDTQPHWPASDVHPTHTSYPGSDSRKCDSLERSLIFDACAPLLPGETYQLRFDTSGDWAMHDHLSPNFVGIVHVAMVDEYVRPVWRTVLAGFSKAVFTTEHLTSSSINFLLRVVYRFEGTLPTNPLYGSYTSEDLVSYKDYQNESIIAVVEDDLEVIRMIAQIGLPATLEKVIHEPSYEFDAGQCHTAMHVVGRMAFDLAGFKAFEECTTGCFSGCYHGALERIGTSGETNKLLTQAKEFCDTRDTHFIKEQCFHGLGHAFMLFTRYNLQQSLDKCRTFDTSFATEACYGGVFMENYIGDPSIIGATNPTQFSDTDLHYPCNTLDDDVIAQEWCYKAQPNHFLSIFDGDYKKATDECMNAPTVLSRGACFKRLGQLSGADSRNPSRATERFCNTIPRPYYTDCITGGFKLAVVPPGPDPEGKPVSFCKGLVAIEGKDICYAEYTKILKDMFLEKETRVYICSLFESPYDVSCTQEQ